MIVLLVIWMLSVALFPQVSWYIARGRDTERIAGIKQISIAVTAYQVNKQVLPSGTGITNTKCTDAAVLKSFYTSKIPSDPIITRTHGDCQIPGVFGYGTWRLITINKAIFTAYLENPQGGNTGTIESYQGDAISPGIINQIKNLKKGSGSGYITHN